MISITRDIGLVSFSGNPILLGVQSFNYLDGESNPRLFYNMFCDIFLEDPEEDGEPIETISIQPDSNGLGQFDLSGTLEKYTKPTLPFPIDELTQAVKDADAVVKFWITLYDGYGIPFVKQEPYHTSDPYYAIAGGLSDDVLIDIEENTSNGYAFMVDNKFFLTSQPDNKKTFNNQIELLRFFNSSESQITINLKVKEYLIDDSTDEQTLWSGNLDALSLYTFNVSPGIVFSLNEKTYKWEIWLANIEEVSNVMSYVKSDILTGNPRQFFMQNSLGGFDSVISTGKRILTTEGETQGGYIAKTGSVRKWLEPIQERRFSKNIYRGSLGYFTNNELDWLKEFFISESKFIVQDGKLLEVTLRQNEFPGATDDPPGSIDIEAVIGSPFMFFF